MCIHPFLEDLGYLSFYHPKTAEAVRGRAFNLNPSKECTGGTVPVVIWEVTAADEAALDRYEGFPNFYYKKDIKLQYKGIRTGKRRTVTAFAYVMHEDRPIGIPTNFYMRTCLEEYDTFYFDKNILIDAYDKCREVCGYEG